MAKGLVLERELTVPVILARRADADEWDRRDPDATLIPVGSFVLEVDDDMIASPNVDLEIADPNYLLNLNVARAYLVEGHARADRRPLCRPIGGIGEEAATFPFDLPLLPLILEIAPLSDDEQRAQR